MGRGVIFQFFEWNYPADGSLWNEVIEQAERLKQMGVTALWLPPAYKGIAGPEDVGYGVYDLYDLGEFEQKGTVRTKYGTREQFLAAVGAAQNMGMHVYADVVLNHRLGGDELEEVEAVEVDPGDRNEATSEPYVIRAWSHYRFPGRGGQYSELELHWWHFTAFGHNADAPGEEKIYRVADKTFSYQTSDEHGNYDYLMGADLDMDHSEVREELVNWGRWFIELTGVHGVRLDAIKHISWSFMHEWLEHQREQLGDRDLFAVGEYWSGSAEELSQYIEDTGRAIHLFDVPLHFRLWHASKKGRDYDLRRVLDHTLVRHDPAMAVTFVDNHDSQRGQALQSWVRDWFKPQAYALILLRHEGYPCVFYGDYFGGDHPHHPMSSHQWVLDRLLQARERCLGGEQRDYFDHSSCIGWLTTGDEHHSPMTVVLSNGEAGEKQMATGAGRRIFEDITHGIEQQIETDADGVGTFICPPGGLSVWCTTDETLQ